MDDKFKNLFSKVKDQASFVADAAGQKGKEVINSSKSNLKIFDLNSEIDGIYKEIGKLIYSSRKGAEVSEQTIEFKIAEIERKQQQIDDLKAEIEAQKATMVCSNCGNVIKKGEKVCPNCGLIF